MTISNLPENNSIAERQAAIDEIWNGPLLKAWAESEANEPGIGPKEDLKALLESGRKTLSEQAQMIIGTIAEYQSTTYSPAINSSDLTKSERVAAALEITNSDFLKSWDEERDNEPGIGPRENLKDILPGGIKQLEKLGDDIIKHTSLSMTEKK